MRLDDFNVASIKTANVCKKPDDPYLIYKVHNNSLDPSRPYFVFKSSKEQLQIAVDILSLGEPWCKVGQARKQSSWWGVLSSGW